MKVAATTLVSLSALAIDLVSAAATSPECRCVSSHPFFRVHAGGCRLPVLGLLQKFVR